MAFNGFYCMLDFPKIEVKEGKMDPKLSLL